MTVICPTLKCVSCDLGMTDLGRALEYNPFEGDFGDPGDRSLRDKIVNFRKAGGCHICGRDVKPGTLGRSLTMLWVSDRAVRTYRYCTACTEAMACCWTDEGKALDVRYGLRGMT
jgi:hypothetical protein